MAKYSADSLKAQLHHEMGRFIARERTKAGPGRWIVDQMLDRGWGVCLFGGAIRNMLVHGPGMPLRDIDIVVANVESEEIARTFSGSVRGRNRFGGYKLVVNGLPVDLWAVQDTWAFRHGDNSKPGFATLPRTTFLTTDAIVVEFSKWSPEWTFIEHRFFESLEESIIDVNYSENPFPSLAIARSIVMAWKMRFGLAPRLVERICDWSTRISVFDVLVAQVNHYGVNILTAAEISSFLEQARDHLQRGANGPLLPRWQRNQQEARFVTERALQTFR